MPDPRPKTGEPHVDGDFDRELSYRGIIGFVIGIALLAIVTFVFAWYFDDGLQAYLRGGDREASPLVEAEAPRLPPKPYLQTHPYQDLIDLHAVEDSVLQSYALIDKDAGKVRIPIAEAMRRVAREGVPEWPAVDPAATN